MDKRWRVTQLTAVGAFAVLYLIFGLFGSAIHAFTGIPGLEGLFMAFIAGGLYVFVSELVPRFGATTLVGCIYGVLALPLPLLGTPGFFPKVLTGLAAGLTADIVSCLLRRFKWLRAALTGGITLIVLTTFYVGLGYLMQMPGIERTLKVLVPAGTLICVLGLLGGLFGEWLFGKVDSTAVVRRIRGDDALVHTEDADAEGQSEVNTSPEE